MIIHWTNGKSNQDAQQFGMTVWNWTSLLTPAQQTGLTSIGRRVLLTDLTTRVNLVDPLDRVLFIPNHEHRVEI